jgi:hypothetical protein
VNSILLLFEVFTSIENHASFSPLSPPRFKAFDQATFTLLGPLGYTCKMLQDADPVSGHLVKESAGLGNLSGSGALLRAVA